MNRRGFLGALAALFAAPAVAPALERLEELAPEAPAWSTAPSSSGVVFSEELFNDVVELNRGGAAFLEEGSYEAVPTSAHYRAPEVEGIGRLYSKIEMEVGSGLRFISENDGWTWRRLP